MPQPLPSTSPPPTTLAIHPNAIRTTNNLIPDDKPLDGANNVFCYAALADKQKGTLYTDATGALPARSLDGNKTYLIAYDYDTNYISIYDTITYYDSVLISVTDTLIINVNLSGISSPNNSNTN